MANTKKGSARSGRSASLAQKVAQVTNLSQGRRRSGRGQDTWSILEEFASRPAVRYVAGGLAAAVLARLAMKMADRYPEISSFIKENIDTVESKIQEFAGRSHGSDLEDINARH